MRKAIASAVCMLLCIVFLTMDGSAAAPEPERPCSLTLYYTQDGIGFSDLHVSIYRVAELKASGTYVRLSPYDVYPVNIYGITSQQEWRTVASTLAA